MPERHIENESNTTPLRIFITGSDGFIGKHLIERLSNSGNELLLLTRKEYKPETIAQLVVGDLNHPETYKDALLSFKPDAVIHLAWEGIPDYGIEMSIKNLIQGLQLANILSETGCKKILCTGSCWEYGKRKGRLNEKLVSKPFNLFTASKNSLRLMFDSVAKEKGMESVWTRLFYVYGPGQRKKSLIPHLIESANNKTLPNISDPNARHDFVFVQDVAEALDLLIQKGIKGGIYNIGSGELTSISEIKDIVFEQIGYDALLNKAEPKPTDSLREFYADISKINKKTGWKPKTEMATGIQKTISRFN